jgi:hypothetical protein
VAKEIYPHGFRLGERRGIISQHAKQAQVAGVMVMRMSPIQAPALKKVELTLDTNEESEAQDLLTEAREASVPGQTERLVGGKAIFGALLFEQDERSVLERTDLSELENA